MVVPADGFVLAIDFGTDAVYRHRLDPVTGELRAGEPVIRFPPGTGPRHLTRDVTGQLHVVGELNATITTLEPSAARWREVSTLPSSSAVDSLPSAIVADTAGPLLYVANRGPDTIAVFHLAGARPPSAARCFPGARGRET